MERITVTPFGRQPAHAGHLAALAATRDGTGMPLPAIDKWALLRALGEARNAFGVSDRDLTVLAALASFRPGAELRDDARLVVFPSNRTLAARLHGMAESTLRRHLAALVRARLIQRHDSPNGKRYARREAGRIVTAFGFDLRPLLARAREIATAAEAARAADAERARLREACRVRLRDVTKLAAHLGARDLDATLGEARTALRRKLTRGALEACLARLEAILAGLWDRDDSPAETAEPSGDDSRNERHLQITDPEPIDVEQMRIEGIAAACPSVGALTGQRIAGWQGFAAAVGQLRPMAGIDAASWQVALERLGPVDAAISVGCIIERGAAIRAPGAYLRGLCARKAVGRFDRGALLRSAARPNAAPAES